MAKTSAADRLAGYERQYRELAAQIADVGIIASRERDPPLHALHIAGLPVQRGPTRAARPLLAVDRESRR